MPTLVENSRELVDPPSSGGVLVHGDATGRDVLVNEQLLALFLSRWSSTGLVRVNLHEPIVEPLFNFQTAITSIVDTNVYDVDFVVTMNDGMQIAMELKRHGFVASRPDTPPSPMEGITSELSPLVLRQVDQIVAGISSKLRERLSQFGKDSLGQEPVSALTKSAVENLVAWLCNQSDTVSATVSSDGVLSVATVFPNDVRVYVEIEHDGSVEAAVTRERRYARDIAASTVSDLTPEVILAAVESI